MFDLHLFLSCFALIAVAELPDKTSFATILMATKRNPFAVFIGVAGAFLVQSVVAVCFGSLLALVPERWVSIGAGILFFAFAIKILLEKKEQDEELVRDVEAFSWKSAWSCFTVIFVAEWGDITQLATASLQARYHNALTILTSATLALWFVTIIAIFIGSHARKIIHPVTLNRIAALAFFGAGCYFFMK